MSTVNEAGKEAGLRAAAPWWLELFCSAALAFAYLYGYYRQTDWFLVAILLLFLTVSSLLYVLVKSVAKVLLRRAPRVQVVKPLLYFGGLLLVGISPSVLPMAEAIDQSQVIHALDAYRAEHGRYPDSLDALPIARRPDSPLRAMADLRYQCDVAGAAFTLSYRSKTVDWHYDSRTGRWRGTD